MDSSSLRAMVERIDGQPRATKGVVLLTTEEWNRLKRAVLGVDRDSIVEAYDRGEKIEYIAAVNECSAGYVSKVAKEAGRPKRAGSPHSRIVHLGNEVQH